MHFFSFREDNTGYNPVRNMPVLRPVATIITQPMLMKFRIGLGSLDYGQDLWQTVSYKLKPFILEQCNFSEIFQFSKNFLFLKWVTIFLKLSAIYHHMLYE